MAAKTFCLAGVVSEKLISSSVTYNVSGIANKGRGKDRLREYSSHDIFQSVILPCSSSRCLRYMHQNTDMFCLLRFKHKAWKLLGKAKTLLDQLKIPFWLSSGTCLGKMLTSPCCFILMVGGSKNIFLSVVPS